MKTSNKILNMLFNKSLLPIYIFLFLGFYSFIFASQFFFEFREINSLDLYKLTANGWYHGTLELRLLDGTFTINREAFINIDNSVFKNKAYSYYAPLPAIFHYILNNFLGLRITSIAQVWFTGFLTLLISFLICNRFIRILFKDGTAISYITAPFFVFALGTTSIYLHCISIGFASYQSTVTSKFFIVLSIFFILNYIDKLNLKSLIFSSISIVAAFFCRHHFIIFIILLSPQISFKERFKKAFIFICPIILGFFILLIWNYLLFEDPFETGISWMNSHVFNGAKISNAKPSFDRIPLNFYSYFLNGFDWNSSVPAIKAQVASPNPGIILHRFPIFSIFISCPLLAIGLLTLPLVFFMSHIYKNIILIRGLIYFLMVTSFALFIIDLSADSPWVRYLYDIYYCLSFIALLGIINTILLLSEAKNNLRLLRLPFLILICICTFWQLFLGLDQTVALVTKDDQMIYFWAYHFNPNFQSVLINFNRLYSLFN